MSFVDLAGSERAQRTGNVGVRLKWVLRVVEGRGLGGAAAAPLCCPFCCVVLPLSCFRKSSPCFARPGTCPAGATLQAAPAPCSLLLQGERGHQQQPDDAGAVPGGAAVEPAAPRQGAGQPAGGALPREQGHPPVQVGGVGAASWGLACFAFWTTKGKDWLGTSSDYALLLLRMQLHPLAVLCRSTRSSPPACPPPPPPPHTHHHHHHHHIFLHRDALHGWGQVVLSVNVSPVSKDYDETAHVLKVGGEGGGEDALWFWQGLSCGGNMSQRCCPLLHALLSSPLPHPPLLTPAPPPHTVRRPGHPDWHHAAGRGAPPHHQGPVPRHSQGQAQGGAAARGAARRGGGRRWQQVRGAGGRQGRQWVDKG